jgi:hypothetical protein
MYYYVLSFLEKKQSKGSNNFPFLAILKYTIYIKTGHSLSIATSTGAFNMAPKVLNYTTLWNMHVLVVVIVVYPPDYCIKLL